MTIPAPRRTFAVVVALALGAATALGCGLIKDAKHVIDTASVLGDFADRLGKAETLTYTAEYAATGPDGKSEKVTLVQKPPNSAFLSKDGRFVFTPDFMLVCDTEAGKPACSRAPNQSEKMDATTSGAVATAVGAGFVTPELALGLVVAAALVPGAKVKESERKIAGQDSLCADVTGVDKGTQNGDEVLKDFSVCVTQTGILSAFNGVANTGEKVSVELTRYTPSADETAFAAPAGAKVTDVSSLPAGN